MPATPVNERYGDLSTPTVVAYSIDEWIMALAVLTLYFALLIVVACIAMLWSDWPEKHGGWLLATKHKLAAVMQLKYLLVIGILILLFLAYLDFKSVSQL